MERKKYNFNNLEAGGHIAVTCFKKDSEKVAYNLKHAFQMYKKRNQLNASYKVSKVIGAVILTRIN